MEDWQYFLYLTGMIGCGICCPVYCLRALKKGRLDSAVIAAFSTTMGIGMAQPFGDTLELSWVQLPAQVYFGAILLTTLLYGLGRLLQAENQAD